MNNWLQQPWFPYAFGAGCALVSLVVGWVVGHLLGTHLERARSAMALAQASAKAREDLAKVETRLEVLREQREALAEQFKTLSLATLDEQSERAEKAQRAVLSRLLQPLEASLADFKAQLSRDHSDNLKRSGELGARLADLNRLSADASRSADALAAALRGSSSVRGNWGETTLAQLLELAGLPKGVAFQPQATFASAPGAAASRQRPDVVVTLPGDRCVVIDAKAVLSHYLDYVAAPDDAARAEAAKAHAGALRAQVKALAARNYEMLPGLAGRTPDFVLLFVPSEPACALALAADPALFDDAARAKVLPVSPATLLVALRIVDLLWRAENQLASVNDVFARLQAVYQKYASFATEMQGIADALDRARAAYDKAFSLLSTGNGNLVRQMQLFLANLPKQKKELPAPFAEAATLPQESDHAHT